MHDASPEVKTANESGKLIIHDVVLILISYK